MEINEFNYEAYALDYAEGNLSGVELHAMEQFLEGQPELKEEVLAIATVKVPNEPVPYPELAELERQPEREGLIIPFSVLAIAASLVLLLGIFWIVSPKVPDGTLADRSPTIRIHYPMALVYEMDRSATDAYEATETTIDVEPDIINTSRNNTYAQDVNGADQDNSTNASKEQKTRIVWKVVEPKPEDFLEMMPESEYRNLEVTELQPDNFFILPITIEKSALQTAGFDQTKIQLAETNEKLDRRRILREGALSVIQQNLVPAGIQDLIED